MFEPNCEKKEELGRLRSTASHCEQVSPQSQVTVLPAVILAALRAHPHLLRTQDSIGPLANRNLEQQFEPAFSGFISKLKSLMSLAQELHYRATPTTECLNGELGLGKSKSIKTR
jgi:hypothetical protein